MIINNNLIPKLIEVIKNRIEALDNSFLSRSDDFGHSNERVPQLTLEKAEDREDILRKLMVQLVPKCIRIKDNTELIENLIQAAYEISFCHDSYLRYFDALNVVYEKFCDRKDVIDHHLWTVFLYRYKIKLENIKDQLEQRCSEK